MIISNRQKALAKADLKLLDSLRLMKKLYRKRCRNCQSGKTNKYGTFVGFPFGDS